MQDYIDWFVNAFLLIRFKLVVLFGLLKDHNVYNIPLGYEFDVVRSEDFVNFSMSSMPTVYYEYGNDKQWIPVRWKPYMTRYFWKHSGHDPHEGIATLENVTIKRQRCHLSCGYDEQKRLRKGILLSNFRVKDEIVSAVIKCPKAFGMGTAFWLFADDSVYEVDIFEHFGQWKNKIISTIHHGFKYTREGRHVSSLNSVKHFRFKPTDKFYRYTARIDTIKDVVFIYINNILVKRRRRTSTSEMQLLLSTGSNQALYKPNKKQFPDEMIIDRIEIYKRKVSHYN